MKKKLKKCVLFLILFFLSAKCFALDNAIGNTSAPASSGQSGLIKSPNPLMPPSGNLTVTGNVTGLSYFHGNIPYSDTSSFEGPLGSSSLDDFLRLTAPVTSPTTPHYLPQPFYPTSGTVSTLAPNPLGVQLTYPSIRAGGENSGYYVAPALPKTETLPKVYTASPLYGYSRTRPLSYEPTDLERPTSLEFAEEENKRQLSFALEKSLLPKVHNEQQKVKEEEEIENSLIPEPAKPAKPAKKFKPENPLQPDQAPNTEVQKKPAVAAKDVYEQMLEVTKKQTQLLPQPIPEEEKKPQTEEEKETAEKNRLEIIEKETAQATVGVYKSFATEANTKFDYYMRSAEQFLKEGKYYSAVDAYTMASIYKPEDPLAYAGRAHALFTSGEYMSSAYFLARAINIFPQYVNVKIDLHAMIPDANRLENRIGDIKSWIQRTNSGELSFLLAYIYYQLDKNELAGDAIKFAQEKLPDVKSVKTLKQAIDKKSQ